MFIVLPFTVFLCLPVYTNIIIHHAKLNCNLISIPQSHSQPVVSAASPVSRCAPDGASGARLAGVPWGQHGLCP